MVQEEQPLVQLVVKGCVTSEGERAAAVPENSLLLNEPVPNGIHGVWRIRGVFWNKRPENLTWIANKP